MSVQTQTSPEPRTLNPDQEARRDALIVAKDVLRGRRPNPNPMLAPEAPDVNDLVDLAEWIITGTHPMDAYAARERATNPPMYVSGVEATAKPLSFD